MKKIEANIKPFELEAVKQALSEVLICGMTVSEVRYYHSNERLSYGPTDVPGVAFIPMIKVEVVVPTDLVEDVMRALIEGGDSLRRGLGNVLIRPVSEAIHIRTGQRSRDLSTAGIS